MLIIKHTRPSLINHSSVYLSLLRWAWTSVSDTEYHRLVDRMFINLQDTIEANCDQHGVTDLDLTYASGVFTLQSPHGTFVLNKQPSTQQIWFSSPISGPKRFMLEDTCTWKDVRHPEQTLTSILETELKTWYPWMKF
ncbi:Mitochondrial chaperone Frataxin [Coelomomyces lativittatus]|nr:Mitochondrial chaperone Frataxin [Coelomomyces lativittatus]